MLGKVKSYNTFRGFGFIIDDSNEQRFFHIKDVKTSREPRSGDLVIFEPSQNLKGKIAKDVRLTFGPEIDSESVLSEISNWKIEAKLEDNRRYFFHTDDVDLIETGSRCYVIGRKGTGKTAIAEFLYKDIGPKKFSEKLTFKNFPFNDLYNLQNLRYTPPNQYITLWKYLIYSSVAQMMLKNESIDADIRSKLAKIYPDDPVKSLARSISTWTSKEFELKILGTGGKVAGSRDASENPTPWIERVDILERVMVDYLDDSSYYIIFDELDEDYKDITQKEQHTQYTSLLTSLFKAVQDVKASFPSSQCKILPVIFLRDDIYGIIEDPDKTKWSDLSIELDWTTDKIKRLLAFRISRAIKPSGEILPFQESWDTICSNLPVHYGSRQRKALPIFDFMTRSTHIRPRDYIRYLKECADSAVTRGSSRISPAIVDRVDKAFSNYLRSELEDEIHGILPEVSSILDIIAHMRKQKFSLDDFSRGYKKQVDIKAIPDRSADFILRILFHFSIIGNQPTQKNIQVFRYLNKEARLNLNEYICVHRGLFKSLQIL